MAHAFEQISIGLDALSKGDLTVRIGQVDRRYESIRDHFNNSVGVLEEALRSVIGAVSTIRSGLGEISSASSDLARRTEQQAASLEETIAALGDVTRGVNTTAEGASRAQNVAATARGSAAAGRSSDMPEAVREIAWNAQARLTKRYRALIARGKRSTVAVTAIARELAAFRWTIARVDEQQVGT